MRVNVFVVTYQLFSVISITQFLRLPINLVIEMNDCVVERDAGRAQRLPTSFAGQ